MIGKDDINSLKKDKVKYLLDNKIDKKEIITTCAECRHFSGGDCYISGRSQARNGCDLPLAIKVSVKNKDVFRHKSFTQKIIL